MRYFELEEGILGIDRKKGASQTHSMAMDSLQNKECASLCAPLLIAFFFVNVVLEPIFYDGDQKLFYVCFFFGLISWMAFKKKGCLSCICILSNSVAEWLPNLMYIRRFESYPYKCEKDKGEGGTRAGDDAFSFHIYSSFCSSG